MIEIGGDYGPARPLAIARLGLGERAGEIAADLPETFRLASFLGEGSRS